MSKKRSFSDTIAQQISVVEEKPEEVAEVTVPQTKKSKVSVACLVSSADDAIAPSAVPTVVKKDRTKVAVVAKSSPRTFVLSSEVLTYMDDLYETFGIQKTKLVNIAIKSYVKQNYPGIVAKYDNMVAENGGGGE